MNRSTSHALGIALVLSLSVACSDDEQDGTGTGGSGGSGGGSAGSSASGTGGNPSAGGGSVGGGGGSSGAGGALTGCATAGGPMCPPDQECCTGVPYPEEGACYKECTLKSDRAIKDGFQSVDRSAVLERLAGLEVTEWSYSRDGESVRHMGPIAQDFRQAFGLGTDGEHIHTVDGQGVTIAAVQALYQRLQQLQVDNDRLRSDQRALEARLRQLEGSRGSSGRR
jgi:hypothetical protein